VIAQGRGPADLRPRTRTARTVISQSEIGEFIRASYFSDAGFDDWGVIAKIWQHTDTASPSDELDIVCVCDDYERA
jgi:hypothetical protein